MIANTDSQGAKGRSDSSLSHRAFSLPLTVSGASTLVVLPTFNEIDNLGIIVHALLDLDSGLDLLIIDDSSPDGTGDLADRLRSETPERITVIHRPEKLGLGTAYVLGFRHALGRDYARVVEMDSDLSHLPEQLPSIIQASYGHGMALGSRYVKGGCTVRWGLHRKALSFSANFFVRKVLGIEVKDATSGYRCYTRSLLERIDLDAIHSKSYAFQIEMVWLCLGAGFSVEEVPISFVERQRGVSKISQNEVLEGLGTVFRLRRKKQNNRSADCGNSGSQKSVTEVVSGEFPLVEEVLPTHLESVRGVRQSQ